MSAHSNSVLSHTSLTFLSYCLVSYKLREVRIFTMSYVAFGYTGKTRLLIDCLDFMANFCPHLQVLDFIIRNMNRNSGLIIPELLICCKSLIPSLR